jgi:hypothetical protein
MFPHKNSVRIPYICFICTLRADRYVVGGLMQEMPDYNAVVFPTEATCIGNKPVKPSGIKQTYLQAAASSYSSQ